MRRVAMTLEMIEVIVKGFAIVTTDATLKDAGFGHGLDRFRRVTMFRM